MLWNPRPSCCGAEVLLTGADGLLCLRPWLSSLCFSHQGGCWHQCYYYRMVGSFSTSNVILINSSYCSHSLRQNLDKCWAMVSFLWITYVHLQNGVALLQSLWHWPDDTEIQHTLWTSIQFWWKRHTHITAGSRGHELDPLGPQRSRYLLKIPVQGTWDVCVLAVRHLLGFQTACSRKLFTIFNFFAGKSPICDAGYPSRCVGTYTLWHEVWRVMHFPACLSHASTKRMVNTHWESDKWLMTCTKRQTLSYMKKWSNLWSAGCPPTLESVYPINPPQLLLQTLQMHPVFKSRLPRPVLCRQLQACCGLGVGVDLWGLVHCWRTWFNNVRASESTGADKARLDSFHF